MIDEDIGADDLVGDFKIKLSCLCAIDGFDEWSEIVFKGKSVGKVHLRSE